MVWARLGVVWCRLGSSGVVWGHLESFGGDLGSSWAVWGRMGWSGVGLRLDMGLDLRVKTDAED